MNLKTISPLAFIDKITELNSSISISNYSVEGNLTINSNVKLKEFNKIVNVKFKGDLIFEKVEINTGIHFYNCSFEKGVFFNGVKASQFKMSHPMQGCNILFSNCDATHVSLSTGSNLTKGLQITNNSVIHVLNLSNSVMGDLKIGAPGLVISESTISTFSILDNCSLPGLSIQNSIIEDHMKFSNLRSRAIIFIKSEFKGHISLTNIESEHGIAFQEASVNEYINLTASRIGELSFHGGKFLRKVKVNLHEENLNNDIIHNPIKTIQISQGEFLEGFELEGSNSIITNFNLNITPRLSGTIKVLSAKIVNLLVSGVNQNLNVLFKNIEIENLKVIDFINHSNMSFNNCKAASLDSSISILSSNLGNISFINFSMKSFREIKIEYSDISSIMATGVDWFEDKQLIINKEKISSNFTGRREVYRQLKQALQKSGNQIDSLIFRSRELKAFRKELKSNRNNKKMISDKITLLVLWTNEYGLNWFRPIKLIFVLTLTYYIILLLSFFSKDYTHQSILVLEYINVMANEFYSNIEIFFKLLNPIRKFNDVYGNNGTDFLYLWDYIHRIILSILVYQVITAFRKYISKN